MDPQNEIDTLEFAQDAGSSGTERPQPFSSLVRVDFGAITCRRPSTRSATRTGIAWWN